MLTDPLAPFQAGVPLEKQMTAGRMNGILAAIKASRMGQGAGLLFTQDSGGVTVSARRPRNPPVVFLDPYAVITPSASSGFIGGSITYTIAAPANTVLYDATILTMSLLAPPVSGSMSNYFSRTTRATGNFVASAATDSIPVLKVVSIYLDGYRPYFDAVQFY